MNPRTRYQTLGTLAVGVATAAFAGAWWPYTVDDAYITARCAANLANGMGSSFNPGASLEVSSSPLSVWLLALAARLGIDLVLTAKSLGLTAAAATVMLVHHRARSICSSWWPALITAMVLATATGFRVHAASGLETSLYGLALTWTVLRMSPLTPGRFDLGWAVGLVAVANLRPEGLPLAILLLLVGLLHRSERRPIVIAGIAIAATIALRLVEHGSLVPNAFHAKPSLLSTLFASELAFNDAVPLARDMLVLKMGKVPIVMGWTILALLGGSVVGNSQRKIISPMILVAAYGIAVAALSPSDWMPGQRYLLPYLPVVLLIIHRWVFGSSPPTDQRIARYRWTAVGIVSVGMIGGNLLEGRSLAKSYERGEVIAALDAERYHRPIGEWLSTNASVGDKILAYEIGAIGYFGTMHVIDHEGVADRRVAQLVQAAGGYERVRNGMAPSIADEIIDHCLGQGPDWFLVRSRVGFAAETGGALPKGVARSWIQNRFLDRIADQMVIAATFTMTRANDRYFLLKRRKPEASTSAQ